MNAVHLGPLSAAHIQSILFAALVIALVVAFVLAVCKAPRADELVEQALRDAYPRRTHDGRTVWACCESNIGPKCAHVQER